MYGPNLYHMSAIILALRTLLVPHSYYCSSSIIRSSPKVVESNLAGRRILFVSLYLTVVTPGGRALAAGRGRHGVLGASGNMNSFLFTVGLTVVLCDAIINSMSSPRKKQIIN